MKTKIARLVLLIAILTFIGSLASIARAQEPRRIEITAKRFSFDPGEITLKKGEPVVLVLKSADVAHGLSIHELNVNVKAKAGGTGEAQFTPNKTGDFVGHCSVFCGRGHGSMSMKVHVE
jgi:cytochrome c oxidase subunit II